MSTSSEQAGSGSVGPGREVLEEVALYMGIRETFVEKDWYVTRAISRLVENPYSDFTLIFTGGTALSKAHKLIERFSEDIDFRVAAPSIEAAGNSKVRKVLSGFKAHLINLLVHPFEVLRVDGRDDNRYIRVDLAYPTIFDSSSPLRPHIKLEFTLVSLLLPPLALAVSSFVNEVAGKAPEITQLACIDPVENAADKLSALTWRLPSPEREKEGRQPDLVRHIHDLAKLSDQVLASSDFAWLVARALEQDANRAEVLAGLTTAEKLSRMLAILGNDPAYPDEYDTFVYGMSYAKDARVPTYREALEQLKRLVEQVI